MFQLCSMCVVINVSSNRGHVSAHISVSWWLNVRKRFGENLHMDRFMNLSSDNFSQIKVSSYLFLRMLASSSFRIKGKKQDTRNHFAKFEWVLYRKFACSCLPFEGGIFRGFIRFNTGFPFRYFNIIFNIH